MTNNDHTTVVHRSNQRGWVMMWFVMIMPFMLIFVGFSLDFTRYYLMERSIQTVTDTAALAGTLITKMHETEQIPIPDDSQDGSASKAMKMCQDNLHDVLINLTKSVDHLSCEAKLVSKTVHPLWREDDPDRATEQVYLENYAVHVTVTGTVRMFTLALFGFGNREIRVESEAIPYY